MRIWILALLVPAALSVPARAAAQLARHPYDVTSYDLNIRPDFTTGEISLRNRDARAEGDLPGREIRADVEIVRSDVVRVARELRGRTRRHRKGGGDEQRQDPDAHRGHSLDG